MDGHSEGQGWAKEAAILHHGFPEAAHQLPSPHSDPETEKDIEECPGHCVHCIAHYKAHVHEVEAAGLGLSVVPCGDLHLIGSFGHSVLRSSVSLFDDLSVVESGVLKSPIMMALSSSSFRSISICLIYFDVPIWGVHIYSYYMFLMN